MIIPNSLLKINIRNISKTCSSIETILSIENRQKCIRKFKAIKSTKKLPTNHRHAAVLVPIIHVNNELALLYTLRSSGLKSHRGQVSFPGGMRDKQDDSFTITALRETEEELGINRNEIDVWCEGNIIPTPSLNVVTPVIGYIPNEDAIRNIVKNPAEVEDVFSIPLTTLCKPENCKYTQFKTRGFSTPVFLGGPKKIWGLTAVITHFLLRSLMPNGCYDHPILYSKSIDSKSK